MPVDWRRRGKAARFDHGEPLIRASSLPFVILFSTLVGLFVTFPKAPDHAVVIDLPTASGIGRPFAPWPDDLATHKLRLTLDNQILWDDVPINDAELLRILLRIKEESSPPGLIFEPDGDASYDVVAKVLSLIASAQIPFDRLCLSGIETYRDFGKQGPEVRMMLTIYMPETDGELGAPVDPKPCGEGNLSADPAN